MGIMYSAKKHNIIPDKNYKSEVIRQVQTEANQYDVNVKINIAQWTEWKIYNTCHFSINCMCGQLLKFESPVPKECKNILLYVCGKCGKKWCFKIIDDGSVKLTDSNSPEVLKIYNEK